MSTPPGREARIAERLGDRYELLDLLGQGGFAAVYRVRNLRLHRIEALKVLAENLSEDSDFARRFEQEARVSAALDHPNIVKIYDYGTAEDFVWFSMQFIDGPSLGRELKRRGKIDEVEAARIAVGVLDALDYSHRRGVVHRDVKPDNVLLDPDGRIFLTDFGVAKSQAALVQTHAGLLLGSPRYMSPEQLQGKPVDGRSDLYSLGVTLYRAVSGGVPFAADDTFQETLRRLNEPPPPLSSRSPGVHPRFEAIVMKALAREPAERFASAREMREAMASFAEEVAPVRPRPADRPDEASVEDTPTRPLRLPPPAPPPPATPAGRDIAPPPSPAAPPAAILAPRPGGGAPWLARALGVLAVAAAGLAAALLLRRSPALPPNPPPRVVASPAPTPPPPSPAATFPQPTQAPAAVPTEKAPPTVQPTARRATRTPRPTRPPRPTLAPSRTASAVPASEPAPPVRRARIPPQLESQAPLILSRESRAAHANESVGLSVTIGVDGTVRSARVISEVCAECDRAALEAVKRFRFRPARDGEGNPVEATIAISIRIPSL
jgi:TonB family protein